MRFFEQQARARSHTAAYVLLFVVAATLVVVAVDVVALTTLWWFSHDKLNGPGFGAWLAAHPALVAGTSLVTAAFITATSLYRMVSLAGGGSAVARELGASRIRGADTDLRRRQLINVVEEMAIAAGVPVPAVYVLEEEIRVNAFAAGYSPADAAVVVTQGMLDHLNREELQGVIAHEFSHILNGDMRLNTRLIGILFGIMAVSVVGQKIFRASMDSRGSAAASGAAVGGALAIVGFIGMLCGRAIQAAVSRSRERLADASAVQFTRNPPGLAGALKKIAAHSGVLVNVPAEEYSHMLVADGRKWADALFATHPPIVERIQTLEPGFQERDIEALRQRMAADARAIAATRADTPSTPAVASIAAEGLGGAVGVVGNVELLEATSLLAALPGPLKDAARSDDEAMRLAAAVLVSADPAARALQIERVREVWGDEGTARVEALADEMAAVGPEAMLPLFELAFPAIRRRPRADVNAFLALTRGLREVRNDDAIFEYALTRLMRVQLGDALRPRATLSAGRHKLKDCTADIGQLFAVLAHFGHADRDSAKRAYHDSLLALAKLPWAAYAPPADGWPAALDRALQRLDALDDAAKPELANALARCVAHDGQITVREAELLRATCAQLHCPLPPLARWAPAS